MDATKNGNQKNKGKKVRTSKTPLSKTIKINFTLSCMQHAILEGLVT